MSEKEDIIVKFADPKIFRRVLLAVQGKLKTAKTLKEQRKHNWEFQAFGEYIARKFLIYKEYEKAFVIYKELSLKKYAEKKYIGMAKALIGLQFYQEAKRTLEAGLREFPDSSPILLAMGNYYITLKDYSMALKYLDEGLSQEPDCEATFFSKGCALFGLGYYEDASLIFRQILEGWPEHPGSLIMIGNYYLVTGYPEEASVYFKKSLSIWSSSPEACTGLYFSYRKMKLHTDALKIAQECFREYHDYPLSYLILADAHWTQGWRNEARDLVLEGIRKFPDDEDLKDFLKTIDDETDSPDDGKNPPLITILLYFLLLKKLERKTK